MYSSLNRSSNARSLHSCMWPRPTLRHLTKREELLTSAGTTPCAELLQSSSSANRYINCVWYNQLFHWYAYNVSIPRERGQHREEDPESCRQRGWRSIHLLPESVSLRGRAYQSRLRLIALPVSKCLPIRIQLSKMEHHPRDSRW